MTLKPFEYLFEQSKHQEWLEGTVLGVNLVPVKPQGRSVWLQIDQLKISSNFISFPRHSNNRGFQ